MASFLFLSLLLAHLKSHFTCFRITAHLLKISIETTPIESISWNPTAPEHASKNVLKIYNALRD